MIKSDKKWEKMRKSETIMRKSLAIKSHEFWIQLSFIANIWKVRSSVIKWNQCQSSGTNVNQVESSGINIAKHSTFNIQHWKCNSFHNAAVWRICLLVHWALHFWHVWYGSLIMDGGVKLETWLGGKWCLSYVNVIEIGLVLMLEDLSRRPMSD